MSSSDKSTIQNSSHSTDGPGIARDAFESARKRLEQNSSIAAQEKDMLKAATGIDDVSKIVADALKDYETKRDSSKVRKWLQKASEAICHYGTVLDVFVQHNPEYMALVWGTMKLLFMSVVNHGDTLKLLARTLCQVAERLPRVELVSKLYPTRDIRVAIERLYSHVMEFLLMAHSWCTESRFRHAVHSLTQPHQLRYNDLLQTITDCTNNIIELTALSSQQEIQVMHTTQSKTLDSIVSTLDAAEKSSKSERDALAHLLARLEASQERQDKMLTTVISILESSGLTINDLLTKVDAYHCIQTSAQLDTNQKITDLQLSQALATFAVSLEDPDESYQHHLFLRNRRASGRGVNTTSNKFWLSPKLFRWSTSSESSQIIIKGNFVSRYAIQDFGIDVIQTLATENVPAIWALPILTHRKTETVPTIITTLRYLTYQALKMSGIKTEKQLSIQYSRFQTAKDSQEWLQLLEQVICSVGNQIYLVMDLAAVHSTYGSRNDFDLVWELDSMISRLKQNGSTVVLKLVLLAYDLNWFAHIPSDTSPKVVAVKGMHSKKTQSKDIRRGVAAHVFRGSRGRPTRGRSV